MWALAFVVVVYLGVAGGGDTIASHGEMGIVIWWGVIAFTCVGVLPRAGLTRGAASGVLLFGAFVAWTALATAWSISPARSLADVSLVACYLGVFVLGVLVHRQRSTALRATVGGLASGIVLVAILAIVSRLWPALFPAARQSGQFLPGTFARLSWPVDYWNALAALMDLGLPLLLVAATSARTLRMQAAAVAAIPVVVLCAALTLSRDGLIAGVIAVLAFYLLTSHRIPKLATGLVAGLGGAVVVTTAFHRHALQQGLADHVEHTQAMSLIVVILLTCAGAALCQTAIGLLTRERSAPRFLRIPVRRARWLSAASLVALLAAALLARVPAHLEHAWRGFKRPTLAAAQTSTGRFGATSGEGRYQYWTAAIHSLHGHLFTGAGPGTFQLLWLPRAPFESYVVNAHSLYIETLAEEGVIGLALLVAFFAVILGVGLHRIVHARPGERGWLAGVVAAMVGFLVFAGFDWIWQVAVLPSVFLLVAAAALAPERSPTEGARVPLLLRPRMRWVTRFAVLGVGAGSLVAIAIPLATSNALAASQAAAGEGDLPLALKDARQAVAAEPDSSAAELQVALVLEQDDEPAAAIVAADRAVVDEPANWANWLTLSRLEVEDGHPRRAVADYRRARSLNPRSSLFS